MFIQKRTFYRLLFIFILAVATVGCTTTELSDNSSDLENSSIIIRVEGTQFRPALSLYSSATVEVDYGDGSPVVKLSLPSGDHSLDPHTFSSSENDYTVFLKVTPWSALSVLNLGFRAGDGGNDIYRTDVPVIMFHPSTDAVPGGTLSTAEIQGYVGKVTAVSNLQLATELEAFCCEQQAITVLDCSGLAKLRTVEAFFSSVKSTSFQGCTELRRCCLESTGASTNWRVVNGTKVVDEVLDLRDSPHLQDIRGTNNDRTGIRLHLGALNTLWHLCTMNNWRMIAFYLGDETVPLADLRGFTQLKECWISGSPLISGLVLTNHVSESILTEWCGITNVNIQGQTQIRELNIGNNSILTINIDGCTNLYRVFMPNCGLTEQQVDYVLAIMDGFNTSSISPSYPALLDLTGNAVPSAAGLTNKTKLESRDWLVYVSE